MSELVGALLEELAQELPEDAHLEGVRADLLAASRFYGQGKKKDLALRFYLAFRSMMVEFNRVQKSEAELRAQMAAANVSPVVENSYPPPGPPLGSANASGSGSYESGYFVPNMS